MMNNSLVDEVDEMVYIKLLERWLQGSAPYLYTPPERRDLTYYGTGENTWGVQTNQKAFSAYAMLGVDPRYDEGRTGMSQAEVRDIALRLLRYSLETHIEGTFQCTDGSSWGHTWISVLGMERMMHAVDALEPYMTDADRLLCKKVMISESDWLQDHYTIVAGLYAKDGNNKPESNLWNGAFLHRTALMYPDAPRAEEYKRKGTVFLINSITIPSDAENESILDGMKVKEQYVGANFFPSLALNHHGYLNVGYMVICLSNMAMLHFAYRVRGAEAPEALYHHMHELWDVIKRCTFQDGRLLRIGGDTRVRYTYCQDYVLPMWYMVADLLGDEDCLRFEEGWLRQIQLEMDVNGDGSFLSERCRALQQHSPLYFTRLESDRASAISMGLAWRRLAFSRLATSEQKEVQLHKSTWHDEYHGAYLLHSDRRIASWVWEAAEKPQGLCLPAGRSDLAEWKENMSGQFAGLGVITEQVLESHSGHVFEDGFLTWGSTLIHTKNLLGEGQKDQSIARNQLVCAALPDDTHMLILQYTTALQPRTFLRSIKGLNLNVPNDIFNQNHRVYYVEQGVKFVHGHANEESVIHTGSKWINIDDQIGVIAIYGTDELAIYRPGQRQIGLKDSVKTMGTERTLYADAICGPTDMELTSFDGGENIVDTGYVLQAGKSRNFTQLYSNTPDHAISIPCNNKYMRGIKVKGADTYDYVLLANFGKIVGTMSLPWNGTALDIGSNDLLQKDDTGHVIFRLPPESAALYRLLP